MPKKLALISSTYCTTRALTGAVFFVPIAHLLGLRLMTRRAGQGAFSLRFLLPVAWLELSRKR